MVREDNSLKYISNLIKDENNISSEFLNLEENSHHRKVVEKLL